MEFQVDLEVNEASPSCDLPFKTGDSGLISSSSSHVASEHPVKKQTRRWAAWTRQEEECFFKGLRLFGKNFEKITSRVPGKDKEQVRHYYYRLRRRMNKLLGPELRVDSNNSKDTNAAMLRWWSLLEKYSCKSSTLHLKPRRFKIFIDALEHQLMKDRKKPKRRRTSPQCESCSSATSDFTTLETKVVGYDTRSVKVIVVDNQNIQKAAPGKKSPVKRPGNNCTCSKGDLSNAKTGRQRRKTARSNSSAAYKRWEKAATAGVSLVADAAEHLERTSISTKASVNGCQVTSGGSHTWPVPISDNTNLNTLVNLAQYQVPEVNVQGFAKLKLQFFPIDEATRRALEKDELNPHLELTLSARKKISSVVEHLSLKWGNSNIASGELMLFPYSAQEEHLAGFQRWTQGSVASAGDVYAIVGYPPVFRLRYGWLSPAATTSLHHQEESVRLNVLNRKEQVASAAHMVGGPFYHNPERLLDIPNEKDIPVTNKTSAVFFNNEFPDDRVADITVPPVNDLLESSRQIDSPIRLGDESCVQDNLRRCSGTASTPEDWADSLTNFSIGELLTEPSRGMEMSFNNNPPIVQGSQFLQQLPFSCDSFDAAIAEFRSDNKRLLLSAQVPHYVPSIWDTEETCDAFSFQKVSTSNLKVTKPSVSMDTLKQIENKSSMGFRDSTEELPQVCTTENLTDDCDSGTNSDTDRLADSTKDLGELTDMYWPDSLGPLDLDMTSSYRYLSQDLMFTDSGLNRLIANSLDAFQNQSFLSSDKKEASSVATDSSGISPALNCKVGSEV